MTDHSEEAVVERLEQVCDGPTTHEIKNILSALQPGDRLPGGNQVWRHLDNLNDDELLALQGIIGVELSRRLANRTCMDTADDKR